MKIVKMPNIDLENFDAFLQTKLQNFDIDKNNVNQYMGEMNFPVPLEERSSWQAFYLYFLNNKKTISTIIVLLFSGIMGTLYLKHTTNHTEKNKEKIKIEVVSPNTNLPASKAGEQINLVTTENKKSSSTEENKVNTINPSLKRKEIQNKEVITEKQVENTLILKEMKLETQEVIKNKIVSKDSISLKAKVIITKQDTVNIIW